MFEGIQGVVFDHVELYCLREYRVLFLSQMELCYLREYRVLFLTMRRFFCLREYRVLLFTKRSLLFEGIQSNVA